MVNLSFAGLTDIGLIRQNNEDVWIALPECGFFALADGMGGHNAGEIAAKEAIDHLCLHVKLTSKMSSEDLRKAIEKTNQRVYEKSCKIQAYRGMGTTLCCLQWTNDTILYAHVGDSRIYRYRNNKIEQLTRDHSRFSHWQANGHLTKEPEPQKNMITRAVGTSHRANPEIVATPYQEDDLFILCSDGLSDVLTPSEMEKIIQRSETLDLTAERLIEKAKIKGSNDNITVLLVQLHKK